MRLSSIFKLFAEIVVVVPETVRLPETTRLLNVGLAVVPKS